LRPKYVHQETAARPTHMSAQLAASNYSVSIASVRRHVTPVSDFET